MSQEFAIDAKLIEALLKSAEVSLRIAEAHSIQNEIQGGSYGLLFLAFFLGLRLLKGKENPGQQNLGFF
jgi:hypothetical protein